MRIAPIIVLLVALASPAWAQTYYTDAVNGNDANTCPQAQSSSTPKKSMGGSVGSGSIITNGGVSCLTVAGTTLIVQDGTYVEGEIQMTVSGTQASPITIKAAHPLLAILSSTSSGVSGSCTMGTNCPCAPNISMSADWVTVDGLRGQIDATDAAGCINNSANGAFVRMWGDPAAHLGGPSTNGHQGGTVRNCQVDASSHRSVGIKSNHDNSLVENCIMHSSLEALNGNNQVFRNNTIDTPDAWGDHFTAKGGARNTQFYNNIITVSAGARALVLGGNTGCSNCWYDSSTGVEGYNQVAYNNVVRVIGTNLGYAVGFTGCQNCALDNNVLINGALFMQLGGQSGWPQYAPSGNTLNNNIISCASNNATTSWGTGTSTTIDYNIFFNCTGGSVPTQTHPVSTSDPLFVNPSSDWHLQNGSPAIDSGVQTTMSAYGGGTIDVSHDYIGTARTVPYDLGIYDVVVGGGGGGGGPAAGYTSPSFLSIHH